MLDRDHVEEIDRVLRGHDTGLDQMVADSWLRCVETYGMDPARADPAHIVTDGELHEHREQSERLIATARSGLQELFRQVAGQNYVLLLADAKGVCVDFFGDPRFEDQLRQAGLYLGSNWTENLAGTCGVGAAFQVVSHTARPTRCQRWRRSSSQFSGYSACGIGPLRLTSATSITSGSTPGAYWRANLSTSPSSLLLTGLTHAPILSATISRPATQRSLNLRELASSRRCLITMAQPSRRRWRQAACGVHSPSGARAPQSAMRHR